MITPSGRRFKFETVQLNRDDWIGKLARIIGINLKVETDIAIELFPLDPEYALAPHELCFFENSKPFDLLKGSK